jgi:FkbH-like protein
MSKLADRIRTAGTFSELGEQIRHVEFSNLDTQDIAVVTRKLASITTPEPAARIALLGTHTFEPLPSYLSARAAASQKTIACWSGPYGQYMQSIAEPAGELIELNPDIILLSAQMKSIAPLVTDNFADLSESDAQREHSRILDHLVSWGELAVQVTNANVLIANFPRPRYPELGVADARHKPSERNFYARLNLELCEALQPRSRLAVLDLDAVVSGYGAETAWTRRAYYLSRQPWQPGLCTAIARELWRHVVATKGWARKCLVVDLDNTLWGGVVGEDGPHALKIGAGDPEGEAFADFQRAIRALKARGVVLAIASKNNADDVQEAFRVRPEMPLRLEDFAILEIGWGAKSEALRNIAATLDIGLDSLVFLDDSPAERLQVRSALPEVVTPEMPEDPAYFASFLRRQSWFERLAVTQDDVDKTNQYRAQAVRAVHRRAAKDLEGYLADLGTRLHVRRARPEDVARLHQLFTKTNQFNVTTRRYLTGEIEELLSSRDHVVCVASAADRYGDLGQIGLFVLESRGDDFVVDSFLLSCRALGRGIETALMNVLKSLVRNSGRKGVLRARFHRTPKNSPARGFYAAQRLRALGPEDAEIVEYEAPIAALQDVDAPAIQVSLGVAETGRAS